jgi:ABC-type metal ion transport system substrate-binding protein
VTGFTKIHDGDKKMKQYIFKVINSPSNSLAGYEFTVPTIKSVKDLKAGNKITLRNPKTKQSKRFLIEYIKKNRKVTILKLRNSHITIVLERSI